MEPLIDKSGRKYTNVTISDSDLFTSDNHFNHTNVIKFCNRPYIDANDMNEDMISKWNSVVGKDSRIFVLGDFAFGMFGNMKGILDRLNGYKILIKGNHDRSITSMLSMGFNEVYHYARGEFGTKSVFMSHYPFPEGAPEDVDLRLCGHVHIAWKSLKSQTGTPVYNVGVDLLGFTPRTLQDIIDLNGELI